MKHLEQIVLEKVRPLIKSLDTYHHIVERVKNPVTGYQISTELPYKEAIDEFRKDFFSTQIKTHFGNISAVAESMQINRRSIHRAIQELNIDVDNCRNMLLYPEEFEKERILQAIDLTVRESGDQTIAREDIENLLGEIELTHTPTPWKEAKNAFDKHYLHSVLAENNQDIRHTAEQIGLCPETIYRKLRHK